MVISRLYNAIGHSKKAVIYLNKALGEGIARHGWRKDTIISYYLIDVFKIIWNEDNACFDGENIDGETCVFNDYKTMNIN